MVKADRETNAPVRSPHATRKNDMKRRIWKEIKLLFLTLVIGGVIAFLAIPCFGWADDEQVAALVVMPFLLLLGYRILMVIFKIVRRPEE